MISLGFLPFFDEMYAPLIDLLSNRATIQRAKTAQAAMKQLGGGVASPEAILVTDAALAKEASHAPIWDAVLDYVRKGGTAVVMGHFSSFVPPLEIAPFFEKAGLPWKSGDYHRTDTELNRSAVGDLADQLPLKYSQKALSIDNVDPGDIWYSSSPNSVVQSMVFPPTNAHRPGQAAAALARVGEGRLGYLGDVNAEKSSNAVVLAMCGLL